MSNLSPDLATAFELALMEARKVSSPILGTPHLFIALTVRNGATASALRAQGYDPKMVGDQMRAALGKGQAPPDSEPQLTPRAVTNLKRAEQLAQKEGCEQIGETHLLLAILEDDPDSFTLRTLQKLGIDVKALAGAPSSGTPILDALGRDLTALARRDELDPLVGRREQLRSLVRTLVRKKKNNPVLVGPAGVGKTAIVEGLAQLVAGGAIVPDLQDARLVELPMAALVADTKYRGQFEERLLGLLEEVKNARNVILFIDEIHTILRAGAVEGGSLDVGNILKPALARGDIRLIGATTAEEYERYIAQDAALERRFQPVWVAEPTNEESVEILRGVKNRYEEHHSVLICDDAIAAAVHLATRWLPERRLPDKALDLLDEACARARIPTISSPVETGLQLSVTDQTVMQVLAGWISVPVQELKAQSKVSGQSQFGLQ